MIMVSRSDVGVVEAYRSGRAGRRALAERRGGERTPPV